ncbi:MAG: DUF1385 domain-containing protein [Bryobacteraceae bacterium]|nr:DUF1385 domain-containing protein [Bryobacteraceae bacterium]MDW8380085.1 DUF1385 domain-containing protein [Bryobacterales bacterium]
MTARVQLLPALESGEEILVGGQAVMEGVMMRTPHSYCVAVRKPGGEIVTEQAPVARPSEKYPLFKFPVLRGLGTLGQAMWLGIRALKFSANAALEDGQPGEKKQEFSSWAMTLNLLFSFGFFIFLYKFLPLWMTSQIEKVAPVVQHRLAFNLVDGVIRIAIFLLFLIAISRWQDIRRVFEFHGAEHKVVFNFESGQPVTVENAQRFSTFHPRCGTSFLLVVMVIAMCIYALLPFDSFLAKFLSRVALLPLIVGLSYELIRYAARKRGSVLALLTAPGLWLQRITTQPPSDDQTAVAIYALEGAMALEKQQGGELVIA